MPGFMPENSHALAFGGAFDFQHLRPLEFHEPRMSQVKWYGKARHAVGREPFLGQPDMRTEPERSRLELAVKLFDALFQLSSADADRQVAEPDIEQLSIGHPFQAKSHETIVESTPLDL